jgi:hypothetical protein
MRGSWVGILVAVAAFLPVVGLALFLNRREPKPPKGDYNDALNTDDSRYEQMNRQGLGWGTRDNDRGGL